MDSVELARQTAAHLHAATVAKGHDPRQPFLFAAAAAEISDFGIERTQPGGTMLDGSRATYIPEDRLIVYEDIGSAFERAFLIAHEIGHAECGDGVSENEGYDTPASIDPARTAEPSPTGLDRVVDYGQRQRREVQMDLFAREFLLPRVLVRRLHLEEGLTLSQIAEQYGAPPDVVAQQLLDALLLPAIEQKPEIEEKPRYPNQEQHAAINHRGCAYLLEAGPGTGKTQTLVARIEHLLAEGVPPGSILVLTFSNKAAGELSARVARKNKEAAAAMWIGTFHAFGLDIVRRFHAELGLGEDPRMLDRTEAVELIEQEFPRLDLVHYRNLIDPTDEIAGILTAISRAKDEVADEATYLALARRMKQQATNEEENVAAEKALEVARVYEVYEKLKRERQCIDFGDLVALPVRLLETNFNIRGHFQKKYAHVLVDEYQDVNRSSVRLLTALRPNGANLWVVGDARQSIYRFRGASSYNVDRFGTGDFSGGVRGNLIQNYRSSPEITAAFSTFARDMPVGSAMPAFTAVRTATGVQPELRTVDYADLQPAAIAEAVEKLRTVGYAYREQAVLCTGNSALSDLGQALERLGIPVLFLGSLFERSESKDLFSLLSLLTDGRAMGLVRTSVWPEFRMPLADVATMLTYLKLAEAKPGEWRKDAKALEQLSPEGSAAVQKLAAVLDGFGPEASPWHVLVMVLLDRTRIVAQLAVSTDIRDRARAIAIWQLMNFVRAQPTGAGMPISRLLDRVRRLLRLRDDRDLRQLPAAAQGLDAVRLMTIHAAKGLEFGAVHLAGMNREGMPLPARTPPCPPPDGLMEGGSGKGLADFKQGHGAEQQCLFYVGCSRAKDRLLLYAAKKKADDTKRQPSPFLQRLGSGIVETHVVPELVLPPDPEMATVALAVEGGLRFSSHQISVFERCPRRFFYTYVLAVGGKRTTTAFMQMHEAVRTVFKEIIAQGAAADLSGLENRVDVAFVAQGLSGHGYEAHYRSFALGMIRYFVTTREGHTVKSAAVLSLKFGAEEILVHPDDVLIRPDGRHAVRSVETGHRSGTGEKSVGAAAFVLAAQQAFPGAVVELVYLSDQTVEQAPLSQAELAGRHEKLTGFLSKMRAGQFPPKPSDQTCPKCPSFFICGPLPEGQLTKKFG